MIEIQAAELALVERLAVTVARAQLKRGENPPINITSVLMLIITRLEAGLSAEDFWDSLDDVPHPGREQEVNETIAALRANLMGRHD